MARKDDYDYDNDDDIDSYDDDDDDYEMMKRRKRSRMESNTCSELRADIADQLLTNIMIDVVSSIRTFPLR